MTSTLIAYPQGQAQKDELIAMIARLEAATGPDRELDESIFWFQHPRGAFDIPELVTVPTHFGTIIPQYTRSIDAALMLCGGEGGLGSLIAGNSPDGSPGWVARVRFPKTEDGEGKTPTLAICIASLRAKQEQPS